jgi:hypothetical protein
MALAALAADMSVPVSVLEETHELPVKTEPFLRGHHHDCVPLLHGRPRDRLRLRGAAKFVLYVYFHTRSQVRSQTLGCCTLQCSCQCSAGARFTCVWFCATWYSDITGHHHFIQVMTRPSTSAVAVNGTAPVWLACAWRAGPVSVRSLLVLMGTVGPPLGRSGGALGGLLAGQ